MNKGLQFLRIMGCCLIFSVYSSVQAQGFQWPGNKKAAVCMTYDDGTLSQLDQATPCFIPAAEALNGFR